MTQDKVVNSAGVRVNDPVEQLFDAVLPGFFRPLQSSGHPGGKAAVIPIDVFDRENEIVLRAEVPGVDKEQIDIQVHGNQVYISGAKEEHLDGGSEKAIYRERRYGEFSRTLQLPVDVDASQSHAAYRDGVLELTLPKAESAKRRKISVQ